MESNRKSIQELIEEKGFVFTIEVNPPPGSDIGEFETEIELVREYVDAVNITDMPGSNLKMSSWAGGLWALQLGGNPIVQYTCRDRNQLALKGDVYGLESFGVKNILVIGGDHPRVGDHPRAKVVYDFDTVSFINWISSHTGLCVGAAMNPGAHDWNKEREKILAKVNAGARFFQTQAVYEVEKFRDFLCFVKEVVSVPVIVGIIPLRSEKMARFMNENIPGIFVPEPIIERISKAEDKIACGMEIAWEIIEEVKDLCQGVHIMPIRSVRPILPLIKRLGEILT